jgi:hypothetical protein
MKNAVFWDVTPCGSCKKRRSVVTDVSKERSAYISSVTRIGELGATLVLNSNESKLRSNTNYIVNYRAREQLASVASYR